MKTQITGLIFTLISTTMIAQSQNGKDKVFEEICDCIAIEKEITSMRHLVETCKMRTIIGSGPQLLKAFGIEKTTLVEKDFGTVQVEVDEYLESNCTALIELKSKQPKGEKTELEQLLDEVMAEEMNSNSEAALKDDVAFQKDMEEALRSLENLTIEVTDSLSESELILEDLKSAELIDSDNMLIVGELIRWEGHDALKMIVLINENEVTVHVADCFGSKDYDCNKFITNRSKYIGSIIHFYIRPGRMYSNVSNQFEEVKVLEYLSEIE